MSKRRGTKKAGEKQKTKGKKCGIRNELVGETEKIASEMVRRTVR